ncbi:MAG: helix-turn-helix domain-containing protein [Alphaproteobacteria bacterium]|nr:helix-turn-helix domain-containing protein [Alphaproteobacteria bacterium]MBU1550201.1 helix-turn-helix domain-containing protein [Alphaproteobacteria bacterium]MBU2337878.1 helix-turn-helix domain-containing protein [Alphaproteobacteria bacterium]MBU2387858.1 helix-turn-helix domain-containing protein [Alphaproteobacteria bacterium]
MTGIQVSNALLSTRLVKRATREQDQFFESGLGTKAATQAHQRQAAALAADRVVRQAARSRPTPEERQKEIGRRRTWGGGGNMPANIRAKYTEAERAALSVVAEQCRRKGFCDLVIKEIAKIAGVSRTSVQNALRKASSKTMAHVSVRERPQQGNVSLSNIVKIICREWLGWIGRAIGFKRLSTSETGVKNSLSERVLTQKEAFERECVAAAREPQRPSANLENPSPHRSAVPRWPHSFRSALGRPD